MSEALDSVFAALQVYDDIGLPLPRLVILATAMGYAGAGLGAALFPSVDVPPSARALRSPPPLPSAMEAMLPDILSGQSLGSDEPYRDLSAFEQPVLAVHRNAELALRAAAGMAVEHDAVGHASVALAFCCTSWDMGPSELLMRLRPMMRELDDRNPAAWLVRARWCAASLQLDKATELLDQLEPQHSDSHRVRATLAMLRGSHAEAAQHYHRAATLASPPLAGPYYARAAVLQAVTGDLAGSITTAQRALERYPPDTSTRRLLSVSLRRRLRLSEALRVSQAG